MAEFCKCGSIMISGSCTNKSCSNKLVKAPSTRTRAASSKTTGIAKAEKVPKVPKAPKVQRASKCITYNINDLIPNKE